MTFKKYFLAFALALTLLLTVNVVVVAAQPFSDVVEKDWFNDGVSYVYENNLMSGTSNESFGPDINMSRAMLVTVLYRLAESPKVDTTLPFVDVTEDSYYYAPVMWCYKDGIVAGTSKQNFSPDANISREQMVTVFARYAESKGLDISNAADLSGYEDASNISSYAVDAFGWAVKAGIISGTSETTLSPQGAATRAQCAVIMQRFAEWTKANTVNPTYMPSVTPCATPIITPNVTPGVDSVPTEKPNPTIPPSPSSGNQLPMG